MQCQSNNDCKTQTLDIVLQSSQRCSCGMTLVAEACLLPFSFLSAFFLTWRGAKGLCIKLFISICNLPQRISDLIHFLTNSNPIRKKKILETGTIAFCWGVLIGEMLPCQLRRQQLSSEPHKEKFYLLPSEFSARAGWVGEDNERQTASLAFFNL